MRAYPDTEPQSDSLTHARMVRPGLVPGGGLWGVLLGGLGDGAGAPAGASPVPFGPGWLLPRGPPGVQARLPPSVPARNAQTREQQRAVNTDGSYRSIVNFNEHQFKIPRDPLDLASQTLDYNEMNIQQSETYLQLLSQTGDEKKIRKLKVRIQEKLAFPFICMIFGLAGSALGTLPNQRTNRATAFGFSILIIFGYYMLAFFSSSLGVRGTLSPELSAWLPIGIGLFFGGLLVIRSAR